MHLRTYDLTCQRKINTKQLSRPKTPQIAILIPIRL